jgi:hypothetical protein
MAGTVRPASPPIAILAVDDEPGVLALVRRCLDDERARQVRTLEPALRVLYLTSHADRLFEAKTQLWVAEAYLGRTTL